MGPLGERAQRESFARFARSERERVERERERERLRRERECVVLLCFFPRRAFPPPLDVPLRLRAQIWGCGVQSVESGVELRFSALLVSAADDTGPGLLPLRVPRQTRGRCHAGAWRLGSGAGRGG